MYATVCHVSWPPLAGQVVMADGVICDDPHLLTLGQGAVVGEGAVLQAGVRVGTASSGALPSASRSSA